MTETKPTYKAGDKITIVLNDTDALVWNGSKSPWAKQVVSHVPFVPPKPVVGWYNVNADGYVGVMYESEGTVELNANLDRIAKLKVIITELPGGKHDVKVEVFNVEGGNG